MRHERKRKEWIRFAIRILVIWAIEVLGLLFMVWLLPGIYVESLIAAVGAVVAIGILNALLWPLLSYLILLLAILPLGLLLLALNAALVLLAGELVAGFQVGELWSAVWLTLGLTTINLVLSSLLTIDDDKSWYRNVVCRRMRRHGRRAAGDGLVTHEGIGFALVHSEAHGPVAIGARGRIYLADGQVEGEDLLAVFGPNAAAHVRRTDSFPDAPDILVSSFSDPETGEVAAFEELIGSHGGLGGWQTQPS